MTERDQPWSPGEPRPTESPADQHREYRASADAQPGVTGGSAGPQGPPQPPASGGGESPPPQTERERMGRSPAQGGQHGPTSPMVDIVESPKELVVYVDTPGFDKDAIQIHADANTISVSADRSSEEFVDEDDGERGVLLERPTKLERTISLPVQVDPEEASASYENGVCKVTIPKEEGDKRREIGFQ